jgi:hypothetical protein
LADDTIDPGHRDVYLEIASQYDRMAEQARQFDRGRRKAD